jgi:MerR family transcriptional regulator, thiopeptide resistance regulator
MEWSIQELARAAGTTSRTLRHYGDKGLLPPSRTGANGYRYYDEHALVRLQGILLLRSLGLGLPAIADVLAGERDPAAALATHLGFLEEERRHLDRRMAAVRTTLRKLENGEPLMPEEVLDGFEHRRYEQEVTERWGRAAWQRGDRWWRSLSDDEKRAFQQRHADLARDWAAARTAGEPVDGATAQALARRHVEWLSVTMTPDREYVANIGQMYVDDPRFGRNYDRHGEGTSAYVRDALRSYAENNL